MTFCFSRPLWGFLPYILYQIHLGPFGTLLNFIWKITFGFGALFNVVWKITFCFSRLLWGLLPYILYQIHPGPFGALLNFVWKITFCVSRPLWGLLPYILYQIHPGPFGALFNFVWKIFKIPFKYPCTTGAFYFIFHPNNEGPYSILGHFKISFQMAKVPLGLF